MLITTNETQSASDTQKSTRDKQDKGKAQKLNLARINQVITMYLYIITDGEFQKIGIAANPHARVKELQTGNPRKLHVLKTFEHDDAQKLEIAFHYLMDSGRQQGEWFKMTDREMQGITMVLDCFDVKSESFVISFVKQNSITPPKRKYVPRNIQEFSNTEYLSAQDAKVGQVIACPCCGNSFTKANKWHLFCSNNRKHREDGGNCSDDWHNAQNPERLAAAQAKARKRKG